MKRYILVGLLMAGALARAQEDYSGLQQKAAVALDKGLVWLRGQQKPDGSWSDGASPALTALPLWALSAAQRPGNEAAIERAVAWLLARQQPDGGIYVQLPDRPGSGLGTYNTSICLAALYASGKQEIMPAILKGRDYIAGAQQIGDDLHTGGFGYDRNSPRRYSDLNNTVFAIDAMRRTEGAEEFRPAAQKRADLNWAAALKYVSRMQEQEGTNSGGFAYTLQGPRGAAPQTNATGRIILHTYGSISYAGLLALVHAKLERSDPRVRSAVDYCARYWTLEENPGQQQQGLYFYYNILARALSASGLDSIPRHNEQAQIKWRSAVIEKLIALQQTDGHWVNENNRWWENDPVLVTAYSLLALEFASKLTY